MWKYVSTIIQSLHKWIQYQIELNRFLRVPASAASFVQKFSCFHSFPLLLTIICDGIEVWSPFKHWFLHLFILLNCWAKKLAETSSAIGLPGEQEEKMQCSSANNQFMCYAERSFRIATLVTSLVCWVFLLLLPPPSSTPLLISYNCIPYYGH